MTRILGRGAMLIGVFLAAALLFFACYRWDNKYTRPGPAGQNGLLALDAASIAEYPVLHLTRGWEIYPGALLTPQEIGGGERRIVAAIGEYAGFEFGDPTRSPHGSATYRLNILLPEDMRSYTLELPEIYSAYRLYINGSPAKQMGDPAPESYRPYTGNSTATFTAAGRVEIVLAATDYSHFYSGLVYPPAFGEPDAVMRLLNTRFALRLGFCALAMVMGLYYLATGFFAARRSRLSLLYGLLCLCFVGYTGYPVVKTLWPSGMTWYGLENFCYTALLLLVMAVQSHIAGTKGRIAKALGGVVCCAALVMPHVVTGSLAAMGLYSRLIGGYAWLCAAYLTITTARGFLRGGRYGGLMAAGILVFDAALVMDRLLPMHEPMLLGWFVEMAGAALVVLTGIIAAQESVRASRERLILEGRIDSVTRLVDMQREYYPVILSGIEDSRALHHDMRHQLRLIRGYLAQEDLEGLRRHLDAYGESLDGAPVSYSRNIVIDTLLRHFSALCAQEGIPLDTQVDMPETIAVQDGDLAAIIGNLLENAVEAGAGLPAGERHIRASVMSRGGWVYIETENRYDGHSSSEGGRFLSRKRANREGIGLASVKTIAARYGGEASFLPDSKNRVFRSRVTLRAGRAAPDSKGEGI